jgi:hypothetical protein
VNNTRRLAFYHGEWPIYTRREWESASQSRYSTITQINKAFLRYSKFITEEQNRDPYKDINALSRTLTSFVNLDTIVISYIRASGEFLPQSGKHFDLQKNIWITLYIQNEVALTVQIVLLAITKYNNNIKNLTIEGTFNPAYMPLWQPKSYFQGIERLSINSFQIQYNLDKVHSFLQAFPNLVHLSINCRNKDSEDMSISSFYWPYLKTLRFHNIQSTEIELFSVFERHHNTLELFSLGNAILTYGSWKSLFTRIRKLHIQAKITIDGELCERFADSLKMYYPTTACIFVKFMEDINMSWPFDWGFI